MNMKIYLGNGICARCGKIHKKIFEIDNKIYGSSCAKEVLGVNYSAPVWLYELSEKIINEMQNIDSRRFKNDEDFNLEYFFWGTLSKYTNCDYSCYEGSKLFSKPFKIYNKNVKVDWQYEINDYMKQRRNQIVEELNK